ncbi:cysteinyl leukotriene receptor 1-like [Tubulanus polymorphus]|uniref:cysteinyl leukotriene receptor 1-like n=1 Tax=Tubulanus polymorphus TaxID=672921 RepID=UPI003DA6C9C5
MLDYNFTTAVINKTTGDGWVVMRPPDNVKLFMNFYRACLFPFILFMGMGGNVLSLIIFPRMNRRDKSTSQYLTFLAASDLVNLITNGLTDSWMNNALYEYTDGKVFFDFLATHMAVCKIFRYLWYISSATSTWTLMLYNVEKCVAIHFPLKRERLITSRSRIIAICSIVIIAMIGRSPFVFGYDLNEKGTSCDLIFDRLLGAGTIIVIVVELITTFAIPCFIVIISNVVIASTLIKTRRATGSEAIQKHGGHTDDKSYRFLVNLISVSVLFLVTVTPACVLWTMFWIRILIHTLYGSGPNFDVLYYALFATNVQDLNFCLNFVVYIACLDFYQQEARKLVCRPCIAAKQH